MMVIWARRRRTALWVRIVRSAAIVGSAIGAAVGAELLRRKLGIGFPRVEGSRNGRNTRMRGTLRMSRAGGRRRRRAAVSESSS